MIVKRVIQRAINIQDCIGVCADMENYVMNILNDKYKNICIQNCYILEILRIINISECVVNQNGLPDFGVINITFEVKALIYNKGEIISGCKVISNEDDIICSTEYADIMLSKQALLKSIQRDQLIPVYVARVKYTIGAGRISIGALPVVPMKANIALKMNQKINSSNELNEFIKLYTDAIGELELVAATLSKENAQAWDFFNQLLYSYQQEQPTPPGAKLAKIGDLVGGNFAGKYVSRDQRLNLATDQIYVYDSADDLPADNIPEDGVEAHDVLLSLYNSYYVYLKAVTDHINSYNTQELLLSHKNLWLIFKSAKLK